MEDQTPAWPADTKPGDKLYYAQWEFSKLYEGSGVVEQVTAKSVTFAKGDDRHEPYPRYKRRWIQSRDGYLFHTRAEALTHVRPRVEREIERLRANIAKAESALADLDAARATGTGGNTDG